MIGRVSVVARRPGVRFALSVALVLCCLVLWALAMPLFSAADEGAHMVKAYAVVHGRRARVDAETGRQYFEVPSVYAYGGGQDLPCFAFRAEQSADCMTLDENGPDHEVASSAATYPPFFYVLAGWPSLVTSGSASLYLMRLSGAVPVALLLAMGIESMARMRRRAPLLLGVAVAVTPAVLYFGAMVNPSGLTIAAAFAAWTGGIFLSRSERLERMGWAAARVGLPLCVLVLPRRDSVLWAALLVGALLAVTSWARLRQLARSWAVWAWVVAVGACVALQLVVSGAQSGSSFAGQAGGSGGSFWDALGDASWIAHQVQGGILGWLDVNLPFPVFHIFLVSTGFLVVGAIGFARRRVSLTVLAMVVGVALIPLMIGTIQYPYFQGRYLMPLTVGVPVMAGLGIVEGLRGNPLPRRLLWLLFPLLAFAQVISFAQAVRRYVSGASADWWFFSSPRWQPPAGNPTLMVVLYTGTIVALFVWWYALAQSATPDAASPPGSGEGPEAQRQEQGAAPRGTSPDA